MNQNEGIRVAMEAFQTLFSDEKTRRSKELWKDYFLSKTFLEVQFTESCLEQVQDYLKNQDMVPYKELPPAFLFELVTAYGMEPLIDDRRGLIQADFMEEAFYKKKLSPWRLGLAGAMKTAAEIWNVQDASWRRDRGGKTIRKWEYRLRGRAFEDYIQLCIAHDSGVRDWEEDPEYGGPLTRGEWRYIQTGRYSKTEYGVFVRNGCVLLLYTYFLRTRRLPESAYVWLWKEYELSEMKAGQQVKAYEGIRQAILSQCPSVEVMANQEKEAEERYHSWMQRLYDVERKYQYDGWAINEYTYALSAPKVTKQERKELQDIFDSPVFQEYKYDTELLETLDYHCTGGNATLGMAEAFYHFYMDSRDKNSKISMLLEHVRARLSYFERIPEYLCWEPFVYDCSTNAADFWYYYLSTAFRERCVAVDVPEDDFSYIEERMIRNGRKYLEGYLEQLYHPSMEWRRRFVGSDMMGRIEKPRCMEVRLCSEQESDRELVIRIEFHLHYIQFYWNGAVWEGKERLSFQELVQYAGKEGGEEHFVLLLALADIKACERETAREEIKNRLKKLPIDTFCLDFVTECLVSGDSHAENVTKQYSGNIVDRDDSGYGVGVKIVNGNKDDSDEYNGQDDDDSDEEDGYDSDDEYDNDDCYNEYDDEDDDYGNDEDDDYSNAYNEDDDDCYNECDDNNEDELGGQDVRYEENLTGFYCAKRDTSVGIVYRRHCFYGWQTFSPLEWPLWEWHRGLEKYGLGSLRASEKKRVVVKGMSDLEKAQQICALLEENQQFFPPGYRKNQQWLEKCGFLAWNSVVLCYGDQNSCYLEKTLYTGLYTEKKSMKDAYAITKKEKNYRVGWLSQDWDTYKTIVAVGESGALWYYEKPSSFRIVSADSVAEIIAKCYRLKEVTAIYLKTVSGFDH